MGNSKVPNTNKSNKTMSIVRIFVKKGITELYGQL